MKPQTAARSGGGATLVAKLGKGAFARLAGIAIVVQANATMRTEITLLVLQVYIPLTARAYIFC